MPCSYVHSSAALLGVSCCSYAHSCAALLGLPFSSAALLGVPCSYFTNLLLFCECRSHMLIHMMLYCECPAHMLIHLLPYSECRAHMHIHLLPYSEYRVYMHFHLLFCWECRVPMNIQHLLLCGGVLNLPLDLFSPCGICVQPCSRRMASRGSCAKRLCDALRVAFGRQHYRRRKLCPLYRSTARLTRQAMTA